MAMACAMGGGLTMKETINHECSTALPLLHAVAEVLPEPNQGYHSSSTSRNYARYLPRPHERRLRAAAMIPNRRHFEGPLRYHSLTSMLPFATILPSMAPMDLGFSYQDTEVGINLAEQRWNV
jgi:hypothetical protein